MSTAPKENLVLAPYQTNYEKRNCKVGIVHVGYGAFHRAHQAVYVDDYMQQTGDLGWGIAAVNLRSLDAAKFKLSSLVNEGYIVKTTAVDGTVEMRKVRSHLEFCDWSTHPHEAERLLESKDTHLITVTVTESGYYLTGQGTLDLENEEIEQELQGNRPRTIYGYLTNALKRRMQTIDQPISILCCDNIRSNGKMLQDCFLTYLKSLKETALIAWVEKNVTFPCSMVDRITPYATTELTQEINSFFGVTNLDPVHAEDFSQWVLEDNFLGTVPDLAKVDVEIVQDVYPYEEAKIRILNGGHTALAYLGALAGYQTFDEAMRDSRLRQHFDGFQRNEVLAGIQIVLPFDKHGYLKKVTDRFCNSAIADQLERICMDGYSKMQLYIRPTLVSCLQHNIEPTYTIDSIASWYVYARRFKSGAATVPYHEPFWDQLSVMLDIGNEFEFATSEQLWGELPISFPQFTKDLLSAIKKLEKLWPA